MRTISFIIAFAVGLVGPSLAGIPDGGLPGIGAFSYHAAPIVTDARLQLVMATR